MINLQGLENMSLINVDIELKKNLHVISVLNNNISVENLD